jgi:peptidoglycan/LPS O-acetylase OafA/YrhL
MESRNSVSIKVAVAVALGIASGLGSAWLIYSLHVPNDSNYWGLAPTAISLLVYGAIAALRLSKNETPTGILVVAVVAGLIVLVSPIYHDWVSL